MPITFTVEDEDGLREFIIETLRGYLDNNRLSIVWVRGADDLPDPRDNPSVILQPDGILVDNEAIAGRSLAPITALTSNDPDDVVDKVNALIAHANLSRTGSE